MLPFLDFDPSNPNSKPRKRTVAFAFLLVFAGWGYNIYRLHWAAVPLTSGKYYYPFVILQFLIPILVVWGVARKVNNLKNQGERKVAI